MTFSSQSLQKDRLLPKGQLRNCQLENTFHCDDYAIFGEAVNSHQASSYHFERCSVDFLPLRAFRA